MTAARPGVVVIDVMARAGQWRPVSMWPKSARQINQGLAAMRALSHFRFVSPAGSSTRNRAHRPHDFRSASLAPQCG